jgi:dethiobiotin synthetase
LPPALDNPVLLPDPLSPHIAAARAGVQIDITAIVRSYQALAAQADAVVVVVGLRLGCLNHFSRLMPSARAA